jgi:hypothetical protein
VTGAIVSPLPAQKITDDPIALADMIGDALKDYYIYLWIILGHDRVPSPAPVVSRAVLSFQDPIDRGKPAGASATIHRPNRIDVVFNSVYQKLNAGHQNYRFLENRFFERKNR